MQDAVNAVPDHAGLLLRFDMGVGSAVIVAIAHDQVENLDDKRLPSFAHGRRTLLPAQGLELLCELVDVGHGVLAEGGERVRDHVGRGIADRDREPGLLFKIADKLDVPRIRHGRVQKAALPRVREDALFFHDDVRDNPHGLLVNVDPFEVHKGDAVGVGHELARLFIGIKPELN